MLGLRSAFVNGPVTNAAGRNMISKRTLISAPRTGDGPLMERRGDRELPGLLSLCKKMVNFLMPM
jgi:hypothetical protein